MSPRTTFIYCLNDPRDGRLRYVGKADSPYRRWQMHLASAKRSKDHRGYWISSLLSQGLKPELEILEEIPMEGWQKIEKEYIQVFRLIGMNLVNATDGGDGTTGWKPSLETRHRMSLVNRGKTLSPEHRMKIGRSGCLNSNFGKPMSLEQRAKIGKTKRLQKLKPHNFGKKASPELRARLSAAHKKKPTQCSAIPVNLGGSNQLVQIPVLWPTAHPQHEIVTIRHRMQP